MDNQFAEIIVNVSHKAVDRVFHYKIPTKMSHELKIGLRVTVPFGKGNKQCEGYVIGFSNKIEFDEVKVKEIAKILDTKPVFNGEMLQLILWMKSKYYSTLADCIKCVIPAGISLRSDYSMSTKMDYAFLNEENDQLEEILEVLLKKIRPRARW